MGPRRAPGKHSKQQRHNSQNAKNTLTLSASAPNCVLPEDAHTTFEATAAFRLRYGGNSDF